MTTSRARLYWISGYLCLAGCGSDGGGSGGTDTPADTESRGDDEGGSVGGATAGATEGSAGDPGGSSESGETNLPSDHALGTITLAETHSSDGTSVVGGVTATFIPDIGALPQACVQTVEGCRVELVPDCGNGCGSGQYCGFGDDCESVCLDVCDSECEDGEVCYFAGPGQSACRALEDFDAGPLAFSGTATPITLFPPYVADGFDSGSPYFSGASIGVMAGGATNAGFEAFDVSFTATTLLETEVDRLSVHDAYGPGPLPVSWSPANDAIRIKVLAISDAEVEDERNGEGKREREGKGRPTTVGPTSRVVTCDAEDAIGQFSVPRAAIDAALDGRPLSEISVFVTRRREERVDGLGTKGQLNFGTVQPDGLLQLVSTSTALLAVERCGEGETVCDGQCVAFEQDSQHCGGCNMVCDGECIFGRCVPEGWSCELLQAANGQCDCGCGALDPECESPSAKACDSCQCQTGCSENEPTQCF